MGLYPKQARDPAESFGSLQGEEEEEEGGCTRLLQ